MFRIRLDILLRETTTRLFYFSSSYATCLTGISGSRGASWWDHFYVFVFLTRSATAMSELMFDHRMWRFLFTFQSKSHLSTNNGQMNKKLLYLWSEWLSEYLFLLSKKRSISYLGGWCTSCHYYYCCYYCYYNHDRFVFFYYSQTLVRLFALLWECLLIVVAVNSLSKFSRSGCYGSFLFSLSICPTGGRLLSRKRDLFCGLTMFQTNVFAIEFFVLWEYFWLDKLYEPVSIKLPILKSTSSKSSVGKILFAWNYDLINAIIVIN